LEETRKLNLRPYINNSYVDKLASQGFIDKLYR
jgi:hypothetical protein